MGIYKIVGDVPVNVIFVRAIVRNFHNIKWWRILKIVAKIYCTQSTGWKEKKRDFEVFERFLSTLEASIVWKFLTTARTNFALTGGSTVKDIVNLKKCIIIYFILLKTNLLPFRLRRTLQSSTINCYRLLKLSNAQFIALLLLFPVHT